MNVVSWDQDEMRTKFTLALSTMYRHEVPLYGSLLQIVHQVDGSVLMEQGKDRGSLPARHEIERHGAIRLGTGDELRLIRRLFAVLGMYPVGYYDLSVVGFPLHATAFRPIDEDSLMKNPFRVFTTVLRKDLVPPKIRVIAESILEKRKLFPDRLVEIISCAESGALMTTQDTEDFVFNALKVFKWHSRSTVSLNKYNELLREHPMIADIACFPSAHINHLTPRTLDIDLVQKEMIKQGLPAKERIEGPPKRQCAILLRQTSFKALEEQVIFSSADGISVHGTHTARFGEVEQRGAAVTFKGRRLYDELLSLATQHAANLRKSGPDYDAILANTFSSYPDTWSELRDQDLVYFRYRISTLGQQSASTVSSQSSVSLKHLISLDLVEYEPIIYEDFLPFSAAGIFKSNISDNPNAPVAQGSKSSLSQLESALGCQVIDAFDLYSKIQQDSIRACEKALNLAKIIL